MKVNIKKLIKNPSRVYEDWSVINLCDDEEIQAWIQEIMVINEEADLEELPLVEPTLELKPLPSSLKYVFLNM